MMAAGPLARRMRAVLARKLQPDAKAGVGLLTVVRTSPPRTTPCRPILRISRATVHRAISLPSRPSCRQTLRTP